MMHAFFLAVCLTATVAGKPWFVVNEDNDHFFKCDSSLMTEKGLTDYADYICRGKVTHVFFCVNGQRTSYDSKTWEPIWAGLDEQARSDTATAADGTRDRWAVNCKKLFDAGIDPYAVWIRRCREKGVSPWVSMRMNDIHGSENPKYFRNTAWYKAHPEFRLDPTGANGMLQQLDYARKEVRDYTMAQVKEIAVRWPADGVELDWMRFGLVFRPNEERKDAPLLDGFMREASAAIRAAGKQVAVRVPYDHEVCEEFGFNVVRWAKEGLVDVVIPAPFINSASDLPVCKWTEALAGTNVRLVPDLGCEARGADRKYVPTVYRGVAEAFFAQGASGVYLYNLPYKSTALYASDSRGKAWCKELDVAAELYANGILPDDLCDLDIDCPVMLHDWPLRPIRNEEKWDALFAAERPRYDALQREIDAKSAAGGGRVEVGGTVYCDGPLRLRSGVELHLADGAKLVFTDNPDRYLPVVASTWEGVECLNRSPLVYAFGATNVALTGRGTLEPRLERWKDWMNNHKDPDHRAATRRLYDWCSFGEPVANRDVTRLKGANVRPPLVQFNRCANVRLEGFRIRQSPFWCVHVYLCRDVHVDGLDIFGMAHNNDGIDIEMSRDILVENCRLRQGDDAIVIKAGRNRDGWRLATPSENIEIRNCRIARGNSVLGIGSEMSGGVRNVWMHDCVFDGFAGHLLQIKTNERRGGFVKDIRVENIDAPGVLMGAVLAVQTDCFYQWRDFPTHEVRVTEISDVMMRNVRAFKADRVLDVRGDARNPVRNLVVENVTAERVKAPDRVVSASVAAADDAAPARRKLFPETILATQAQLYPWREQSRGYLGRYANQPLLVDPDLPEDPDRTDIPEFPNWGNFHSQADYDRTLELAKASGIDALALFVRKPRFLRACADSPVKGMYTFPIMFVRKGGTAAFVETCRRVLENPCAWRIDGKMPMVSYWTSKFFTPGELKAACDAARAELGDRFIFFASMPVLAREWVRFEQNGRKFVPGAREELKGIVRSYLEAADGIQLSEAHMLAKLEGGERVFAREYWDAIHALTVEVMSEPQFAGRKYLASAAVNSHMNFYKGGHEVCENGTRSLRDSFEVALKYNPDYIQLPEWDEFNENTCFEPTLYCSYAVTRIVRHYSALAKGRPLSVREGDDVTLPNLIVSYRKSLAPGERLMVEVLNVPDGARSGDIGVRIELADPDGRLLRTFEPKTLDESKLAEARFIAGTAELAPKARAVRVRLVWTKDGRDVRVDEGLHPVDLAPANAWNHLCCKQPIRDLARLERSDLAFDGRRFKASFACAKPIRYAMLCGNGCIQAVVGKPGSAPHLFREDETHAVFQITAHRLGPNVTCRKDPQCSLAVKGVPGTEWLFMKRYEKGETFSFRTHRGDGKSASYYVRLPKSALEGAVLTADFPGAWTGHVDLATAFREGTYAVGDSGGVMQFTVTRFGLQGRYPSVADAKEVAFDVPVDRDRDSMVYHAQVVLMDGSTWFSRPFVLEPESKPVRTRVWDVVAERMTDVVLPAARVPEFACDFSPRAGNAILASTGERHWTGMLGGPFTPSTLWNRGCLTEGVTVWDADLLKDPLRSGVPGRVREPDGTWSLVFDGVDDYLAFPIETIPAGAAFSVEMDIWPEARTDGKPCSLLSARDHLANFGLDGNGHFVAEYRNLQFGKDGGSFKEKAVPGRWTHVKFACTGEELVLTVDGRTAKRRIPVHLPAHGSRAISVGGCQAPADCAFGFFKGRIRNLRFSHRAE